MKYDIWQVLILAVFLVPAAITDIRKKEISPVQMIAGMVLGGVFKLLVKNVGIGDCLMGLLPGILLIIAAVFLKNSIGMGDAVTALFVGCVISYEHTMGALMMGFILAAVFGLVMICLKKMTGKSRIPFVPFLSLGVLICGFI